MDGATLGVRLGMAVSQIGSKVREESLARTTPALTGVIAKVVDAEAGRRAEAARMTLVNWLESKGVPVPADGELSGLLGALRSAGGWLMQNVLGTAIGFAVGSAMSATLTPYFNDMTQAAWRSNPSQLLTPAELAALAARGWIDPGRLISEALSSGLTEERAQLIRRLNETPLGTTEVLELLRRGEIDEAEADRRLHHLGIPDGAREMVLSLRTVLASPDEALLADLQAQLPRDEAQRLYELAGGRPEDYEWRFNNRGTAPTPTQALELLNRRIIPERGTGPEATSYEQAFLEGPWRNKWLESFLALRTYIVPPRSVVPMVRSGAWDVNRGIEELTKSGVPDDVAAAMVTEAAAGKLEPERDLAKGELLSAFRDGLVNREVAASALGDLGYDPEQADLILAIEDARWERSFRDAGVRRIRSLYVGRKITDDEAQSALASLGIPGTGLSKFLALWDIERELPTADLTEAQVRGAWRKGIVDETFYRTWLGGHGYSPEEVEILAQLNAPAEGPA